MNFRSGNKAQWRWKGNKNWRNNENLKRLPGAAFIRDAKWSNETVSRILHCLQFRIFIWEIKFTELIKSKFTALLPRRKLLTACGYGMY